MRFIFYTFCAIAMSEGYMYAIRSGFFYDTEEALILTAYTIGVMKLMHMIIKKEVMK